MACDDRPLDSSANQTPTYPYLTNFITPEGLQALEQNEPVVDS